MALECRILRPEDEPLLGELFEALRRSGAGREFHPHPLTREEAARRCRYIGRDLYYVLLDGARALGYGMLRGWDEGYEVPSLGIAIHPDEQGRGLGTAFMHLLHAAAKRRGARRVRLKVYPRNLRAVRLYEGLGYRFEGEEHGQLVGFLDL
jgi:ribosomal-protein-alanine N-acetyltransferase